MSDILRRRRASDTSAKLRLPFIIYCITILFQALSVRVLANTSVSANTVDPVRSHTPSKTVSAQIAGGTSAREGEFPYAVAIFEEDFIVCSGVILSSQWVLTAAQCLVDPSGTHNSTNFELNSPKSDFAVGYGSIRNTTLERTSIKEVWVHPQYNPREFYYDIALLELATPLPSDGKWRPVRIMPKIVGSGDELIAIGWGDVAGGKIPDTLQKMRLKVGSNSRCQYGSSRWNGHSGEFVCVDSGRGRGICPGDGGGPLVLPTSPVSNESFAVYLVGTFTFFAKSNSFSEVCSNIHLGLNYFTRVAKYADWIASVMGVSSSELLAAPEDWISVSSATPFLPKRFDDMFHSIMLCSLALAAIVFNN
jgi:secreted trypsin-like serine protease